MVIGVSGNVEFFSSVLSMLSFRVVMIVFVFFLIGIHSMQG